MNWVASTFRVYWADFTGLVRAQALIFICAAILILASGLGTAALILDLRTRAIQESERSTQNLSYVLAEQTDRAFQSAELITSGIVERLQHQGILTPEDLERVAAGSDYHTMLLERAAGAPSLDSIAIVSERGMLINRSRFTQKPHINLRGRDYIEALRDAQPFATYMSRPARSPTTNLWQMSFAQRISAPGGELLGVVIAVTELRNIESIYAKVALGTHGSITLARGDGVLLARYPHIESLIGSSMAGMPTYRKLAAQGLDGVTRELSALDNVDRIIASARVKHFPLVLYVTEAISDVLAPWKVQSVGLILRALVLTLVIAVGGIFIARRMTRLARAEYELGSARERERVQQELTIQHARFDVALRNICQGLAMYDAESRLIVCNPRYAELYGLPPELVQAGTPRGDILRYRNANGTAKRSNSSEVTEDGCVTKLNELEDGRVIALRRQPLAEGGWVTTHEDITLRRRAEQKISHLASHDALTDLPNRVLFHNRLQDCLAEVPRGARFAVLYIDLDRFKPVNDTLGHSVGDLLLKQVTGRLEDCLRGGDMVARIGGDEFAVVARLKRGPEDAAALATRLIQSVSTPYDIGSRHEIVIGASIGIALAPEDGEDAEALIRNADLALYHTKAEGRGSFSFFRPEMHAQMRARRRLEIDLRKALAEDEFDLHFQPIVRMTDRRVIGFEALLRWNSDTRGRVSPVAFIPLAEEIGLIVPIGAWVIRNACRIAATWPDDIKVAINISAVQFRSPDLVELIANTLAETGLPGNRLDIEITESVLLNDTDNALTVLHDLRSMGIGISLDDFGTGYSSLSYLHRFPFDKIKIDRSFVSGLGARPDCDAIVRATASLARSLSMATTAEGIETEDQFVRAAAEGCSEAQGYLISRPLPACDVLDWLEGGPDRKAA